MQMLMSGIPFLRKPPALPMVGRPTCVFLSFGTSALSGGFSEGLSFGASEFGLGLCGFADLG